MKKFFVCLIAFLTCFNLFAQQSLVKENIAILPFAGGSGEDGETIAELFMFDRTINDTFTPIPRTSITQAIRQERIFQLNTGMTDPDSAVRLGRELGAKFVVSGTIAKLGNQNLLVIGIINTETFEQIAGDIQTFSRIEEMPAKLPAMAQNITTATKKDTSTLPKLATTRI